MEIDPNVCLENLRQNKIMSEREVRILCQLCKEIFFEESNVHVILFDFKAVNSPVNVCGDIHG
jgi:hypothetical protein